MKNALRPAFVATMSMFLVLLVGPALADDETQEESTPIASASNSGIGPKECPDAKEDYFQTDSAGMTFHAIVIAVSVGTNVPIDQLISLNGWGPYCMRIS
jgi:hypothetical protein